MPWRGKNLAMMCVQGLRFHEIIVPPWSWIIIPKVLFTLPQ
jgi:hypothetical protein